MKPKIPATIVTGFLGSGKTTLIRHLLQTVRGRRIALIVNEFGDLGIDGELLRGCGDETCSDDDIVELSNGCICCTVADDFIPTMERLLARTPRPDHIVIETSGLALPQPLVRAFNWPGIRNAVTVDGVVAVVDGAALAEGRFAHDEDRVDAQRAADPGLDHETPLADLFEDQLACADLVVLGKTDLVGPDRAEALVQSLADRTRPGVGILAAAKGDLPPEILLGIGAAAEADTEAREEIHHHHHDPDDDHDDDHHDGHDDGHHDDHGHDAFESFVVSLPEIDDPAAFARAVAETMRAHDILRLKGFCAVAGKPMRLALQAVGPRVETHFDRPFGAAERGTRLVVIGRAGLDRRAITDALAGSAAVPA